MPNDSFMIFTGTANTRLAVDVVNHLDMSLGRMTVGRFSDGEVMAEINENVRGKDVFVLQPTCAPTRFSRTYHRSHSIFWLCEAGPSPALGARGDHGQGRGQHAPSRWC
jgi:hypothetical protein